MMKIVKIVIACVVIVSPVATRCCMENSEQQGSSAVAENISLGNLFGETNSSVATTAGSDAAAAAEAIVKREDAPPSLASRLYKGLGTTSSALKSGFTSGLRWLWGTAPQAHFNDKNLLWQKNVKKHSLSKLEAMLFIASRSFLHASVGAGIGGIIGGAYMKNCHDAAGMAILCGGVTGVLSGLCQRVRTGYDSIVDDRKSLIVDASRQKIDANQIIISVHGINKYVKGNPLGKWIQRRENNYIADQAFKLGRGRQLLASEQ